MITTIKFNKPNHSIKVNIVSIIIVLFALRALSSAWLAFDNIQYSVLFSKVVDLITLLTFLGGIVYVAVNHTIRPQILPIFLPIIIFWTIIIFHTYGGHTLGNGFTTIVTLMCFALMQNQDKAKCFNIFYRLFIIQCFVGILVYVAYSSGLKIGFSSLPFYAGGGGGYCIVY